MRKHGERIVWIVISSVLFFVSIYQYKENISLGIDKKKAVQKTKENQRTVQAAKTILLHNDSIPSSAETRITQTIKAVVEGIRDSIAKDKDDNNVQAIELRQDTAYKNKVIYKLAAQVAQLKSNPVRTFTTAYGKSTYTPATDTSAESFRIDRYQARLIPTPISNKFFLLTSQVNKIIFTSDDPALVFDSSGSKSYTYDVPPPSFGGRIRTTAIYNPNSKALSIGPEFSLDVKRFQLRWNIYYNVSTQKLSYPIGISYTNRIF